MVIPIHVLTLIVLCMPFNLRAELSDTNLNDLSEQQNPVRINKCCETKQLMIDSKCRLAENYNKTVWSPKFWTEDGKETQVKYLHYVPGVPDCATTQQRAIFSLQNSEDELQLLSDGRLKHLIHHEHSPDVIKENQYLSNSFSIHDDIPVYEEKEPATYIHVQTKYCIDKIFMTKLNKTGEYALVCVPEVKINWTDSDFLLRKILNPLFHALTMIALLLVAIIYFVLPTLRDLAGNIITSITVCLIFGQAADLVKVFTKFSNHVSFMVADVVLYVSLLSAFFWLNSFGFYIWKTFKSRNVFLRVTDVRKYCYYSCVVWPSVITMTVVAISAHFLLDTTKSLTDDAEQETIGWLGIAVFFTPIAFTIIFNVFFYVTTLKTIRRINIYGRIHHKLKGCFDLFLQLFLIMTVSWLFLMLSWLHYDGLVYAHIVVNFLQGILILYACVVGQPHVVFLLRKSCCYAEPVPTSDWGDEMTHYI